MRTAITMAHKHSGGWDFLSNPDVPVENQKREFTRLSTSRTHPVYDRVVYQESDGERWERKFQKPADAPVKAKPSKI